MIASERIRENLKYTITVAVTFIILQAVVVVMHEFTHSTLAWILGYMKSPLDIVWGNPLMLTGWDEGVHYSKLFTYRNCSAEAIIGGSPLILHTVIVTLGLVLMQGGKMVQRRWLFHVIFWFVIANFMELIAYIVMRAFASGGDVGHFNRGLGISPWILFIAGSSAIVVGLYVLFEKILPRMYAVFARGNRLLEGMIIFITAFLLFVWGSGLRIVLYVYPDPQWMFGLVGFAAFGLVLVIYSPARQYSD